jgi:hypothetical protein
MNQDIRDEMYFFFWKCEKCERLWDVNREEYIEKLKNKYNLDEEYIEGMYEDGHIHCLTCGECMACQR